nr:EOG090X0JRY [Moina brachiata]
MAHSQLQACNSSIAQLLTSSFLFPGRDLTLIIPLGAAVVGIGYYLYKKGICCKKDQGPCKNKGVVNLSIRKDEAKIVDTLDIEDIGEKKVFCRCWRSKLFPYCDGSHNQHNNETGDNVGPLIIGKKSN